MWIAVVLFIVFVLDFFLDLGKPCFGCGSRLTSSWREFEDDEEEGRIVGVIVCRKCYRCGETIRRPQS